MPDSLYGIDASAYRLFAQQTSDLLFEYAIPIQHEHITQSWDEIFAQAIITVPLSDAVFERMTAYPAQTFPDIFSALESITDDEQLAELHHLWESAYHDKLATVTLRIHCNDFRVLHWQVHVFSLPHQQIVEISKASPMRYFLCSIKDTTWKDFIPAESKHEQDEAARQTLELQMTRERYKFLAENMSDLIVLRDARTHTLLYVSPSVHQMLGYTPEQYHELSNGGALVHPDDRLSAIDTLHRAKSRPNEGTVITRLRHADGHYVWLESRVRVMNNEQGEVFATISSSRDITQRIEAEEALKQSEHLYRLLSDNMHDAVMLYDKNFQLLFVSPSVQSVLGYTVEEYTSFKDGELIYPDDVAGIRAHIEQTFAESDKHLLARYRVRHKNGIYIWIESRAHIVPDSMPDMLTIWQVRDVSKEVEAEQAKERAEKEMRKALDHEKQVNQLRTHFMTMASHQFRTPLTVIRSHTDLINLQVQAVFHDQAVLQVLSERDRKRLSHVDISIRSVHTEIDRIVSMLDDIAILGDIETGKVLLAIESHDICLLIAERIRDFQASTGRTMMFVSNTDTCVMRCDWHLLRQVFNNICSNALKYSEGKPDPQIRLIAESESVRIEIQDFGLGIPAHEQSDIFKSFGRAHNVLNIQGTGLGLVIAQAYIGLHGGTITFTSKAAHAYGVAESKEIEGTTFTIVLPREQNSQRHHTTQSVRY